MPAIALMVGVGGRSADEIGDELGQSADGTGDLAKSVRVASTWTCKPLEVVPRCSTIRHAVTPAPVAVRDISCALKPQTASPLASRVMGDLKEQIEELWGRRDQLVGNPDARELVYSVIARLDRGEERVAELVDGEVVVHEWLKKAILLMFSLSAMKTIELGPFEYADKIPLKQDYAARGVRVVPGATARFGAFLERASS